MTKRRLIIGGGGFLGAYGAGALATLCRSLGPEYFNEAWSCSVGTLTSPFVISNQPEVIELVWRHLVDGKKVLSFANPLRKKDFLNLDYLVDYLFQTGETKLDTERVLNSKTKLVYTVTERDSGTNKQYTPSSAEEIFKLMKASCSLPVLTSPVRLNGSYLIDGGLSNPLPLENESYEKDEEIVVIYNKPLKRVQKSFKKIHGLVGLMTSKKVFNLLENFEEKEWAIEEKLKDSRIKIIRPKTNLPLKSILDTDKERINLTFDMGVADAKEYLRSVN